MINDDAKVSYPRIFNIDVQSHVGHISIVSYRMHLALMGLF